MEPFKTFCLKEFFLIISLILIGSHAYADQNLIPESDINVLEGITVTAQKTEQNAQDVGISITTFTEQDIKELAITYPKDIANHIPNVQVIKTALPFFSIRGMGVNEFAPNTDSPVAIHIDEIYQSKAFQITGALFDIERIEVLKGPQGTLFGRNTTGGSVNFTTKKPTLEHEAGITLGYSRFDRKETEGYISGPINNNLLGRLSGYAHQSSEGPSQNSFTGDDLGKLDVFAVRGQLLWLPDDESALLLNVHGGEDNSELMAYGVRGTYDAAVFPGTLQPCSAYFTKSFSENSPGCVLPSGTAGADDDPYTANVNRANKLNDESYGASLRYSTDFSWATLTSITAYEYYKRDMHEDDDGSPIIAFEVDWFNELNEYTQEIRLSSRNRDGWSWLLGIFFEHDDLDVVNVLDTAEHPLPTFNGLTIATSYRQSNDSIALFGQTEYPFMTNWTLITGLRYTREKIHFDGITQAQLAASPTLGQENKLSSPLLTLAKRDDFHETQNISFKLGMNYQPYSNQLYYGSVSSGFKSGGFNGGFAFSTEEFSEYKPEEILAFEIGSKITLLNQNLQINTSAFYYQVTNPQLNADGPTPPSLITTNADSSQHIGAEVEAWWHPLRGLDIKLNLGWLDAEYGDFFILGQNQEGNEVVNSPEWTLSSLIRYEYPLSNGMKLISLADASYRSDRHLESSNILTAREPGYWLVNARLALATSNNEFEIGIWGKNITNEKYRHYVNDVATLGVVGDLWDEPFTYGIDVSYQF
ncbi:MAG: TonB-dependent receptor [Piscirickettsiaceae bacterium]|nr:TonB-dependent receptor [Piscirickettsiaceae bacterium]